MKSVIGERKLKEQAMSGFNFTNEQMFFIGHAQFYCDKKMNDHKHFSESIRNNDPHAANKVRVNAVSMLMEEFRTAFSCKSSDRMVTEKNRMCHLLSSI